MVAVIGPDGLVESEGELSPLDGPVPDDMASPASQTLRQRLLGREGFGYLVAMTFVNVSNFAFHILVSRQLGPSSYGAVSALLNIVTFVSIPLLAFQAAVVVDVAKRGKHGALSMRPLFNMTLLVGLGVTAMLMLTSPAIADFLSLGSVLPVVVLSTWFVTTIPTPALAGASMGQFRFKPVAVASVAGAIVRLVLTGLLGWWGVSLEAPLIGTAVGSAVTMLVLVVALRPNLRRFVRHPLRLSRSTLGWTLTVLGGYSALVGVDTVLARHDFASAEAGRYAAAATAAHTALFVAASIAPLVFPRFLTEPDERRAKRELLHSSLLVGVAGFGVAGLLTVAPNFIVGLLFGARFQGIAPELRLLGVESALLGIVNVVTYFLIARRSVAAFIPWIAVVGLIGGSLTMHIGPELLAWAMLAIVALCTLSMSVAAALWRAPAPASDSLTDTSELSPPPKPPDRPTFDALGELDLSLVVPFYNPGTRLIPHLVELLDLLRSTGIRFEIVAVSDGSSDGSDKGLETLGVEVQVIRLSNNAGKGTALTTGFAHCRGRYVGFIDGDGDIPADALRPFITLIAAEQPEMALASKWHPDSEVACSMSRRASSWAFQILVRLLLRVDVTDTQAGLKLMRRDLMVRALPLLEQPGFALDVELLALARRMGYSKIVELPVQIQARVASSISARSALSMTLAVVSLWWKVRVTDHYGIRPAGRALESPSGGRVAVVDDDEPRVRPARILIFNWRDLAHPRAGGAEVWTHEVARAWVRRGCEVTVFCSSVEKCPPTESVDGVQYVRRGSAFSVYRAARRFYRRECRGRFDLVIDEVNTRPFGCASWVRDTPVMSVIHQMAHEVWFYELPFVMAMMGRLVFERRWLRQLQNVPVVTVSASSKRSLEELGLRQVTVVPEGFNLNVIPSDLAGIYPQKAEQPTLCWVGRLTANKRPDHALRAFEAARPHLPGAQLWMIGSGPMSGKLKRMASDSVRFFGRVSEDEKHSLMGRAHALLATSVREGWGLTVTEAAAVGTTTIGYAVPGLVDSIAASGGYLVPPSIEELGDEIVRRVPRIADGEDGLDVYPAGVLEWSEVATRVLANSPLPASMANLNGTACRISPNGADLPVRSPAHARQRPASGPEIDRSASWRRLALLRWGMAGVGLVALAGSAAAGQYGGASEDLANISLVALGVAATLLVIESRRTRKETSAWLPLRGSSAVWRGTTIAVALVSTLACQRWFSPSGAIAGGDVAPPIGTAWLRGLFAPLGWSGSNINGPAANETRAPWAAVLWVVHEAGGSAVLAERIWMTALFAGAALAALWLLRVLGCGPGAAALGTAAYLLNCYVVSSVATNPVYLAALVLLALFPAIVFAVARRQLSVIGGGALFLLSVPFVGYVYQNPPLVLLLVAVLLASALVAANLGGRESLHRVGRVIALGGGLLVVGGMYWIVPALIQVHVATNGSLANTGSWTWTEGRATTANAFWLNTDWGWIYREYFPFAPGYSHLPLSLLRYLFPVAAFAVLLLPSSGARDRTATRRLALVAPIALGALVLVAFSTGTNPPGSIVFDRLYTLPYGWLLREPGRFLMGAGLAYAVLLALGVDALARGVKAAPVLDILGSGIIRRTAMGTAFVGLVAVLPGYPLLTGQIVPTSRGILPSEHVNVPAYWPSMASAIDRAPGSGAVLMLPTDDFYQMPYKWGYYGSDTFSEDLISRPVLDPVGQGYTPASNQMLSTVQLVSQFALSRQWVEVNRLLHALDAPYLLVRGDINSSFPNRDITSPVTLDATLRNDPDMHVVASKGPLDLFASDDLRSPSLAPATAVATPQSGPDLAVLGLLAPGSALVTETPQSGAPFVEQLGDVDGWDMRSQALVTTLRSPPEESPSLAVLGTSRPALVHLGRAAQAVPGLTVKELSGGRYRFSLAVGRSLMGASVSAKNDGWGPVQDCDAQDPRGAHLAAGILPGAAPGGTTAVQVSARGDRACLQRPVRGRGGPLVVSLDSREESGPAPEICLWETPARRCAPLPALSGSSSWRHYQAVASIPRGQTVRLFLYATFQGGTRPTVSDFADVSVHQLPDDPPTLDLVGMPTVPNTHGHLWVLDGGTGSGWRSTTGGNEVSVDGMLTGWIEPPGSSAPKVSYPLGRLVRIGQLVSVATILCAMALALMWLVVGLARRRRRV